MNNTYKKYKMLQKIAEVIFLRVSKIVILHPAVKKLVLTVITMSNET